MRAGSYPASDSFGTNTRYDGLLWNWQAQEAHDAKRGTPLGEDIHAYYSSNAEHIKWNYQQTAYPNAGTSGAWSKARTYDIGGQMYDPSMDAYTPPAWESAAQTALAVGGIGLITGGLGWVAWGSVAWMAGGTTAGGLAGAGISAATGGDVWAGADRGMLVGSFAGPGVFRAGGAALARLGQFAAAHPQLARGLAVGGAALIGSGLATPSEAAGAVPVGALVRQAVRTLTKAQKLGAVGERRLARIINRIPDEVVFGKPGKMGSHGADFITFNRRTRQVTFWDAKAIKAKRSIKMSSTFTQTSPWRKAVTEARLMMRDSSVRAALGPDFAHIRTLLRTPGATVNIRTVSARNTLNSVFGPGWIP